MPDAVDIKVPEHQASSTIINTRGKSVRDQPKWHFIYYVLAAFDVLTISFTLYLSHQTMGIYAHSIEVNKIWSERLQEYSRIGELAAKVNAPGNDVFDSRYVEQELIRLEQALDVFNERLDKAKEELRNNVDEERRNLLFEDIAKAEQAIEEMVKEAKYIFDFFRKNQPERAGERMATMDHKFYKVNSDLAMIRSRIGFIQSELFDQQMAEAAALRKWEYVVAGLIFFIVCCVTVYGHFLARKIKYSEEEKERFFNRLSESEARMQTIVNTAGDGIISMNEQGIVDLFNKAAEDIFGYNADEIAGKNIKSLIPWSFSNLDDTDLSNTLKSNKMKYLGDIDKIVGKRKDGTTFPIDLSFSEGIYLEQHNLFTCVVRDITHRRKVDDKLRQAACVFENSSEGIVITDNKGRIQSVNPAFIIITGYRPEELIGENSRKMQFIEENKASNNRIWHSLNESGHWQGEIRNKRKNGEDYPAWLTISAVKNIQGVTTKYVENYWDITKLKEAEQIKDEFISTVSHELRTPLTSIQGSLGLIAGGVTGPITEQTKNMVDISYRNTKRLINLVNDLLDFEKIQAGKLNFDFRHNELNPLIDLAIQGSETYSSQLGVQVVVENALPGVKVVCDSDRIIQVLINLLSNAVKFSQSGAQVTVSLSKGQYMTRVTVTDHGAGIPECFRDKVFEKFSQIDSSDSRQKGGTGLGLHICKLIIEKHGGKIGFESVPHKKTTFFFDLPLAATTANPDVLA